MYLLLLSLILFSGIYNFSTFLLMFMPRYFVLVLLQILSPHYCYIKKYRFLYICITNHPTENPFQYNSI